MNKKVCIKIYQTNAYYGNGTVAFGKNYIQIFLLLLRRHFERRKNGVDSYRYGFSP